MKQAIPRSPKQPKCAVIAHFQFEHQWDERIDKINQDIHILQVESVNDELVILVNQKTYPATILQEILQSLHLIAFQIDTLNVARKFTKNLEELNVNEGFILSRNPEVLQLYFKRYPLLVPVLDVRNLSLNQPQLFEHVLKSRAMLALTDATILDYFDYKIARSSGLRIWVQIDKPYFEFNQDHSNVIYGILIHNDTSLYMYPSEDGLKSIHTGLATIAHRGIPTLFPENSLSGIRHAIQLQTDIVEFDIHTSLDHQLVVMHDENTARTTGQHYTIKDTSSEVLSHVMLVNNNTDQPREYVPLISQTLQLFSNSHTIAFIEIKDENLETAPLLIKELSRHSLSSRTQVISFSISQLMRLVNLESLKIGWLNDIVQKGDSLQSSLSKIYQAVVPLRASYNPYYGPLTDELVYQLHLRGIAVWPWTIDNENDMIRLIEMGVDGITTNNLPKLQSILAGDLHDQ